MIGFAIIAAPICERYGVTGGSSLPFGNAAPHPVVDCVGLALPAFTTRDADAVIHDPRIDAHCGLPVSVNAYWDEKLGGRARSRLVKF